MPLVQYLGNASPADNTEILRLGIAADGTPRTLAKGSRALVSATELRSIAANYSLEVIDASPEEEEGYPADKIPTKMPEGYDENGYKKGEAPASVIFTPEAYPDTAENKADSDDDDDEVVAPPITSTTTPAPTLPVSPTPPSGSSSDGPPAPPPSPVSPGVSG